MLRATMKRWLRYLPCLLVLILAPVLLGIGPKVTVMSVGDSWAEGWCEDMELVLRLHGHPVEVFNKGISATSALIWAQPGALADVKLTLLQHPEIEWLMLSLGGNDLLDGYLLMGYGDEVFPLIEHYLRIIIDELISARPSLKISLNGYDFPNFEQSPYCIVMGQVMLGGNTYTQNLLFAEVTAIAERIAGDYEQVYHTDLLGTLQQVDGVPFAPNFYRPSPARFFPEDDCIHPSDGGYYHIMQTLYDGFFAPLMPDDDDDTTDDDDDDDDDDNDDNNDDNDDDGADDDEPGEDEDDSDSGSLSEKEEDGNGTCCG